MKCFECDMELKKETGGAKIYFCPKCFAIFNYAGKCRSLGYEGKEAKK